MNGIDFLIDTNVFIYAMEEHPAVRGLIACAPVISVISEIELLGKKDIPYEEAESIKELLHGFPIISFSDEIKKTTIKLKQKYTVKLPDAVIAATAQNLGLTLITADKGFSKIQEIDTIILDLNKI